MLTKQRFYELMCNMLERGTFEDIHEKWFNCFDYMLRSFKVGFNKNSIKSLFYDFQMDNWEAMHKENNPIYYNYTKGELIESFSNECHYICDRFSYDRIFRTHWLFRQAFYEELTNYLHGDK